MFINFEVSMVSNSNMFQDIASILDPEYNVDVLASRLAGTDFNWDFLVKMGSSHLILPTIYCKLKEKGLLQHLPEDLVLYLEEITSLNRNRNLTIIEEVKTISSLFNAHQIEHVFLKGAALLVSDYYNDVGERMVGDIDVLVRPEQLFKAQNLMIDQGYKGVETTFGHEYFEHKHLPRLSSDMHLAALEIHRKVLEKPVKGQLEPLKILKNKQLINKISIASPTDLLSHAVLNFQINDYGYDYNFLGFRSVYDTLILLRKVSKSELKNLLRQKHIRSFFTKLSLFYDLSTYHDKKKISRFYKWIFMMKLNNAFLNRTFCKCIDMLQLFSIIIHRLFFFMGNASYRKESFKDRKRIFKLIKNGLFSK